jgi:hypothetical protein
MPIVQLHRTNRTKESSKLLQKFAFDETSQFGEDGILEELFKRIGTTNKWCVEFGAWDGKLYSNTWRLIAKFDWSAVLIEGMEDRARDLAQLHKASSQVHVQNCYVSWTGENRLDNLLADTPIPRQFDLLSIDIDGNDFHVWSSVEQYRPRVVVIEFNPSASNDLFFVQDADARLNEGCSLRAVIDLAKRKGYELAATTLVNAIFVTEPELSKLGIEDNSIDAMHFTEFTTELFQGYDGCLFAAGFDTLIWQGKKIDHEALQIIPKHLRKYPPVADIADDLAPLLVPTPVEPHPAEVRPASNGLDSSEHYHPLYRRIGRHCLGLIRPLAPPFLARLIAPPFLARLQALLRAQK